jgi:hypothetical protein
MHKPTLERQSFGKITLITSADGRAGKTYFLECLRSMFPPNSCAHFVGENYYKNPYVTKKSLPALPDLTIAYPQLALCLIDEAQFFGNIEEIQKYKEFGLSCVCAGRRIYDLHAEYEKLCRFADNIFLFSRSDNQGIIRLK